MEITLLEPAQQELEEVTGYYDAFELGLEFRAEFYRSLDRISANPESYALVAPHARRCMVRRFKYAIIYEIEPSRIVVLAVVHERRNPKAWQDRT